MAPPISLSSSFAAQFGQSPLPQFASFMGRSVGILSPFRVSRLFLPSEPVPPILGHGPGGGHFVAHRREVLAAERQFSQAVALMRAPALVPLLLVPSLTARGRMAVDRRLASAAAHHQLQRALW